MKALASPKFVGQRENVIFLGSPRVGKTHLAVALGLEACQAGDKVAFTSLHDLVNELHASLADRSLARIFKPSAGLISSSSMR